MHSNREGPDGRTSAVPEEPVTRLRGLIVSRLLSSGRLQNCAASVRRMPVVGAVIGRIAERAMPRHRRIWAAVLHGPGQGLLLALPPRVGVDIASGEVEPNVQAAMLQWLRPGSLFVDVGSNVGFFTLLGARLVGPAGTVVAFEADPEVCSWLKGNVSRNAFNERVRIESAAVWRHSGPILFERADPSVTPDRGTGHLAREYGADPVKSQVLRVEGTSLDDYFTAAGAGTSGLRLPDLVKMDLEGSECDALLGAEKLLSARRSVWIVEVHEPPGADCLVHTFRAAGYRQSVLEDPAGAVLKPRPGTHLLAVPPKPGRAALGDGGALSRY